MHCLITLALKRLVPEQVLIDLSLQPSSLLITKSVLVLVFLDLSIDLVVLGVDNRIQFINFANEAVQLRSVLRANHLHLIRVRVTQVLALQK